MSQPAEFSRTEKHVVGLRLANGIEIWPPNTWHGRSIETKEDRQVILDALAESAKNLGIPADLFESNFRWVVRTDVTYVTKVEGEVRDHGLREDGFLPEQGWEDELMSFNETAEANEESDNVPVNGMEWVGAGPDPRTVVDTGL